MVDLPKITDSEFDTLCLSGVGKMTVRFKIMFIPASMLHIASKFGVTEIFAPLSNCHIVVIKTEKVDDPIRAINALKLRAKG
jgi:hypothetical protein